MTARVCLICGRTIREGRSVMGSGGNYDRHVTACERKAAVRRCPALVGPAGKREQCGAELPPDEPYCGDHNRPEDGS